ncbi:MAG: dTDP-4-dehydrorhamnose 3,5-epimerase family protein [Thermomonas sp.]
MKWRATPMVGLYEIDHTPTSDPRGRFTRLFCERELTEIRPGLHFSQINLSETIGKGTVRGLHYQSPPCMETKLIRCLRGRVYDVAVDVRAGSPTFLKWHGVELAEDNDRAVLIPEGFAHGFQALTEDAHLLYMHTSAWSRRHEHGLRYDDPRLGIDWPLPPAHLSQRDRGHDLLDSAFAGMPTS